MIDSYKIGYSEEFSEAEIMKFKQIVIAAGEVAESFFDGLIYKNPILLLYPNVNSVDAVGALKIPHVSYKKKVFIKSETIYKPEDFTYELEWIVSTKLGKGTGKILTSILFSYKSSIYATVREENRIMRHILESLGLSKTGESYLSERCHYKLCLYIKEK